MSENLNLTEEQKAKIRPILEDEAEQLKALRADTSLSPEQSRAKARESRSSTRSQIDQILTPEQKGKRTEMQRKARERREERSPTESGAPQ